MYFCRNPSTAGRSGRRLCVAATLLAFVGALLFMAGLALVLMGLDAPSTDSLKSYEKAVEGFDADVTKAWLPAVLDVTPEKSEDISTLLHRDTRAVNLVGANTEFAPQAASSFITRSTLIDTGSAREKYRFDFSLSKTPKFSLDPDGYEEFEKDVECDTSPKCTGPEMLDKCRVLYGGSASYLTKVPIDDCKQRQVCGVCQYKKFLSNFCVVVKRSEEADERGTFVKDNKLLSCQYPFDGKTNAYNNEKFTDPVNVTVMIDDDPYIVAQRLTKGTMDFNIPDQSTLRRTIGIILFIFSGAPIAISMILFYKLYRAVEEAKGGEGDRLYSPHEGSEHSIATAKEASGEVAQIQNQP